MGWIVLKNYKYIAFGFHIIPQHLGISSCCDLLPRKTKPSPFLSQYHGCWWPGNARSHSISSHSISPGWHRLFPSLYRNVDLSMHLKDWWFTMNLVSVIIFSNCQNFIIFPEKTKISVLSSQNKNNNNFINKICNRQAISLTNNKIQ